MRPRCGPTVEERLDHPAGDGGREQGLARVHGVDAGHEHLGLHVLEQEPAGACLERVVDVVVHVEGGQHDDLGRDTGVDGELLGRLDPVDARHPDVHQDDVGREVAGPGHGLLAVGGLADHVEVGLDLEDHPEAAPDQRLVVGDQDLSWRRPAPAHAADQRQGREQLEAPSARGRATRSTAVHRDPLLQAEQTVPRLGWGGQAAPVVADGELESAQPV